MKTTLNQAQVLPQKLTANAKSGDAVKLNVVFTNTQFMVPINFGRSLSGDAKSKKFRRHPFTTRAAIRKLRVPAEIFTCAMPQEGQTE